MINKTLFLTLEQILTVHTDQIERYGGSHGLRDLGLLESAIYRPQSTFGGEELYQTIFDKAASLLHSLIANHPFVDGNKRTATASVLLFLKINGCNLVCGQEELVKFVLDISVKKFDLEEIASWIEKHV